MRLTGVARCERAGDTDNYGGGDRPSRRGWPRRRQQLAQAACQLPRPGRRHPASPEFDLDQVEQWLREQGKLPELGDHRSTLEAPRRSESVARRGSGRRRGPVTCPPSRSAHRSSGGLAVGVTPARPRRADRTTSAPQGASTRCGNGSLPRPPLVRHPGRRDPPDGRPRRRQWRHRPRPGRRIRCRPARRRAAGCASACGQELDEGLARLAGLWLALRDVPGEVRIGRSLRADAFAGRVFDNVVCHPPFGATQLGDATSSATTPAGSSAPPHAPNRNWRGCSTFSPMCALTAMRCS